MKWLVCFFRRNKWEAYYRGNNKICGRCEKVIPTERIIIKV